MNYEQVKQACSNLSDDDYIKSDISIEQFREVVLQNNTVYRINNPIMLVVRKGGSTHRVVDSDGVVHCYAAPELGKTVIRWKNRDNEGRPIIF